MALSLSAALGDPDAVAELETPEDTDVRWAVHREMWRTSPLKKVRACRRWAHDHDGGTVPLVGTPNEHGGLSIGFGNLKTCACWHSCLVCSVKIAVERAKELEHILQVWAALGGQVIMATFSVRHHRGQSLRSLIEGQRAGWAAVQSDRPWKRDKDRLGIRFVIRALEITVGDEHGWHPHFHAMLFIDPRWVEVREQVPNGVGKRGQPLYRTRRRMVPPWQLPGADPDPRNHAPADPVDEAVAAALLAPMWNRWCEGLATHGMTALDSVVRGGARENAGFDVTVMDVTDGGGATGMARYPFKLALEAVGGVFKHGREEPGRRHRTPFEVMEHLAVAVRDGDQEAADADRKIIDEYSTTANELRLRQAPLPPGMRAWMAEHARLLEIDGPLLADEKTDEEIAEAQMEGAETLADVPEDAYSSTIVWELDTLRAVARYGGWPAVQLWFDLRGIAVEPRPDCPLIPDGMADASSAPAVLTPPV